MGSRYTLALILRFFPDSAYYQFTGMSERALAYWDADLRHRLLVVFEAAGAEAETASYLMRSLLSEGCIKYMTVDKESGTLAAREITLEGPTGLSTTSTRDLHAENETRLLTVNVSDTREQTRAVLSSIAMESKSDDDGLDEWKALQEWVALGERRVTIPFSSALAS